MLLGAFASYYVALQTDDLRLAVLAGIAVGVAAGLATAFMSVTLKAEQGISGIGVYLFGARAQPPALPEARRDAGPDRPARQGRDSVPRATSRARQDVLPGRTCSSTSRSARPGRRVRAQPDDVRDEHQSGRREPAAADSLGVSVARIRYATVTIGSALAGLAGATLMLEVGIFQQNLTQAVGFIAVALVYFGGVAAARRDARGAALRHDAGARPLVEGARDHPAQRLRPRRGWRPR